MTRKYIVAGIVSLIVLVSVYVSLFSGCRRISCLSFDSLQSFYLKDIYEEKRPLVFRGIFARNISSDLLRVDIRGDIEPGVASDYIHGKIAGMKALYDNIKSPYPGIVSNEIVCDDGYKPTYDSQVTRAGVEIYQIHGYLNERQVFGACQKEQIKYKVLRILFSCPKRKMLYDMEFIARLSDFSEQNTGKIVQSIQCL